MSKTEVLNILQPGKVYRVDTARFETVRSACLAQIPDRPPGLTPAEIRKAILPHLPDTLFPGGEKAGWWVKCVQLDLEARGVILRGDKPPVRLWKA